MFSARQHIKPYHRALIPKHHRHPVELRYTMMCMWCILLAYRVRNTSRRAYSCKNIHRTTMTSDIMKIRWMVCFVGQVMVYIIEFVKFTATLCVYISNNNRHVAYMEEEAYSYCICMWILSMHLKASLPYSLFIQFHR